MNRRRAARTPRWGPAIHGSAAAAVGGALAAREVPVVILLAVLFASAVATSVWQRPVLLVPVVFATASVLGARSWDGYESVTPGPFDGVVTLTSDPEPAFGAVRVDVRAAGRRVEAWARGRSASALTGALAGERWRLAGRIEAAPDDQPWLVPRHVVGRLHVTTVGSPAGVDPVSALANRVRRTLSDGTDVLPDESQTLASGLVLGDDRGQHPVVVDDFRGSGLSHLLAVSGQNVAFLLVLASPVTRRLRPRWRWLPTCALLVFFAVLTRLEPSVLRATAMAALAVTASAAGRPLRGLRLLSAAVATLVLIDPFLVHAVAFQLSVGASAGILVLAGPLAALVPGPAPLRRAVGVTIAAQVGVAPVQIPVFGGIPLASMPANLLAGPAAAPVVMWSLTGGLVAGLVGPDVSRVLHLPTGMLVGWIAAVARWAARLPLGEVSAPHAAVIGVLVVVALVLRRRGRRVGAVVATLGVLLVCAQPAWTLHRTRHAVTEPVPGALLVDERVVVIDGSVSVTRLLEGLRRAGVARLDLVISTRGGSQSAGVVAVLRRRYGDVPVLAPVEHRVAGAEAMGGGGRIVVGGVRVVVRPVPGRRDRLEIDVDGGE